MSTEYKIKAVSAQGGGSAFGKYRALCYGTIPLPKLVLCELVILLTSHLPGALGLFLRAKCYRFMFKSVGRGVVFGRGVVLRHAHKIVLGDGVVVDDYALLDAKGGDNRGISIGDGVYIGRESIVYCKNGDITLEDRVNLSSRCTVFSSNQLTIGAGTMIGAYSYLLSGGEYDPADETPFADQTGMQTSGPLTIGADSWLGARVTVLDAACLGERCVIGAGAVVTRPLPAHTTAVGVPARPLDSPASNPTSGQAVFR